MRHASLWIVLAGALAWPGAAEAQVGGLAQGGGGLENAQKEFGWPAIRRLFKPEQGKSSLEPIARILLIVLIAAGCGAVLAYHPHYLGRIASLVEMDHPKIIITYTVVGALAGLMVAVEPSLAFAIFGIGGLMRFRTELAAAKETGRVILATLIGILCGLELWLVVLFSTLLAWMLIFFLDLKLGLRIQVRGLDGKLVGEAAGAYQAVIESYGLKITQIRRNPHKGQFSIVFKGPRKLDRDALEAAFDEEVDEKLHGTIDWPEEG